MNQNSQESAQSNPQTNSQASQQTRFVELWVTKSNHLIMVAAFLLRFLVLFRAKYPMAITIWFILDYLYACILVYITIGDPKKDIYLDVYFKGFLSISIIMYQAAYGPGGRIYVVGLLFTYLIFIVPEFSLLEYLTHYTIFILSCSFSFYYFGEYSLFDVFYIDSVFILAAILLKTQMIIMKTLMDKTVEDEKDLMQQKTRHMVLASTSHELRNPLQALTFLISFLDSVNNEQVSVINEIKWTMQILNSIIENVLDYSKMEYKKIILREQKFNLLNTVESTGAIFYRQAESKSLKLYILVDPDIPSELLGDSVKITQILSNLISNAIKYTNTGYVFLTAKLMDVSRDVCKVKFTCIDTGIGMNEKQICKLFIPFTQMQDVDSNIVVESRGWGLGLSVTKDLIQTMGGDLNVESELGKSTTLTTVLPFKVISSTKLSEKLIKIENQPMYLMVESPNMLKILTTYLYAMGLDKVEVLREQVVPTNANLIVEHELYEQRKHLEQQFERIFILDCQISSPNKKLISISEPLQLNELNRILSGQKQAPATSKANDAFESFEGLSILIVEDNQLIHKVEKKVLLDRKATVISAFNGQEALEQVNKSPPFDCIVMDIKMPVLDGISATKLIRNLNDPEKASTPVLVVSGNFMDRKEANNFGANEVLFKPINAIDLIDAIRRHSRKKSADH